MGRHKLSIEYFTHNIMLELFDTWPQCVCETALDQSAVWYPWRWSGIGCPLMWPIKARCGWASLWSGSNWKALLKIGSDGCRGRLSHLRLLLNIFIKINSPQVISRVKALAVIVGMVRTDQELEFKYKCWYDMPVLCHFTAPKGLLSCSMRSIPTTPTITVLRKGETFSLICWHHLWTVNFNKYIFINLSVLTFHMEHAFSPTRIILVTVFMLE